ncbi:MAG: GlxA family transcriptional regulator [Nakamurella sp.]
MSTRNKPRAHRVAVVITPLLPIFELATACEVFGTQRPDLVDPWYRLRMVAGESGDLRIVHGMQVPTDGIGALRSADTIIVPACERATQVDPPEPLLAALRRAHQRGARIASLCTGAYILAAAGLLDGQPATTHWMNLDDFAVRYPRAQVQRNVLFTESDRVFTSAGTAASIDLCLHLLRQDHGAATARTVARRMVVSAQREGGQAQFVDRGTPQVTPPPEFAEILDWAGGRLEQPLTVDDLAGRAHLSRRQFHRSFTQSTGATPLQWIQAQRVRLAQELLETTDRGVEQIATEAGFGSANNLRTHFQRITSVTPHQYRRTFRTAESVPT